LKAEIAKGTLTLPQVWYVFMCKMMRIILELSDFLMTENLKAF